jgi:hypothetical protein
MCSDVFVMFNCLYDVQYLLQSLGTNCAGFEKRWTRLGVAYKSQITSANNWKKIGIQGLGQNTDTRLITDEPLRNKP